MIDKKFSAERFDLIVGENVANLAKKHVRFNELFCRQILPFVSESGVQQQVPKMTTFPEVATLTKMRFTKPFFVLIFQCVPLIPRVEFLNSFKRRPSVKYRFPLC